MNNLEITPAILEKEYKEIKDIASNVIGEFNFVQIDVLDAKYVKNYSFPYPIINIEKVCRLNSLDIGFDLDLMIEAPENTIDLWCKTKARKIIVHHKSTKNLELCILKIKKCNKIPVIAFTVDEIDCIDKTLLEKIDFVQCMGIEIIGVQGQSFTDKVFNLIEKIKRLKNDIKISVDGGVSIENILKLKEKGVNSVAIGSKLVKGDIKTNIQAFKNIL